MEKPMSFEYVPLGDERPKPPDLTNRRGWVRYQCRPATGGRVLVGEKQEMQRGWLLNLSQGGAAMLLNRPLEAGQPVVLRIQKLEGNSAVELAARVVHSAPQLNGDWAVGFEFVRPLTDEELETLL
jgi:c-di-GMP-binding flagellar brake protein YcgR